MTAPRPGGSPADDLTRVVGLLARHLPEQLGEALALPRFAADVAALERLRDPRWAARGAAACTPAEARRLTALALRRWALLAPVPEDALGDPSDAAAPGPP